MLPPKHKHGISIKEKGKAGEGSVKIMKERPILFSGAMVTAILEGRKTQTRRVVKPVRGYEHNDILKYGMPFAADPFAVWWHSSETDRVGCLQECPYGKPGDRLWVRESWRAFNPTFQQVGGSGVFARMPMRVYANPPIENESIIEFKADNSKGVGYKPSIHMPRWMSRITLEITNVRVERLNDISYDDTKAEGWGGYTNSLTPTDDPFEIAGNSPSTWFRKLWDHINGKKHPWESNPYVWVIEFKNLATT